MNNKRANDEGTERGKEPRLKIVSVSKSYPGVKALKNVSVEVLPGEVHAFCGENGAGKSTLMRMVAGVETPDEGEIYLDGERLTDLDEHKANKLGVGMVHQERSLIPSLSIAENVYASRQPVNWLGVIDHKKMHRMSKELLQELKLDLDPALPVGQLSPAQQQMVEIAKALSHDLRILILDEPTAALTMTETEHLFEVIRHLKARGVAIIYISHRLAEVFEICDRVTVLKDGERMGVYRTSEVTEDDLIRLMVGRDLTLAKDSRRAAADAEIVLEVENLAAPPFVIDASLKVRKGEIVCLAGLVGAGRTELCETIFGVRRHTGGKIRMHGKGCDIRSPRDAMAQGIGMVPEDRKEGGLFLEMSVCANMIVTDLDAVSTRGMISVSKSEKLARSYVERLRIATPHIHQPVVNLSGGNQQKVLLSKWLARRPELLIIDEPTKGVDVGARADIYNVLRELAASGIALLIVSSDLPEVLVLAHRIVVMCEGRTAGELDAADATELDILRLASPNSDRKEVI